MNKWIVIAVSIALVLSFTLVYLLSPNDADYLARYTPENYVTVAAFDVPLDGNRIVDVVSSVFPFHFKTLKMDIDRIEIRINRNISGDLSGYMRENLKAELYPVPVTYERFNLEISFPRPVRNYMAETFGIVRIFDHYNELMREHAELMICVPMNYEIE
ncbi:MAG: hypothetical protein GX384_04395 [Clostridiaceae bacterium]|jgi:hypothetical protein|nr:hypothetical protein [Clostridiaceae bacterium]